MMRLFTAIAIPDDVREKLASIQPEHPDIRLTPESQIHLTMRFIGETDKTLTRRVLRALTHVTFRPFEITLSGTGCFPNPSSPYVLWAGVRYHPVMGDLYDTMQEELFRTGIPYQSRTFHPHITLGRIRQNEKKHPDEKPPLAPVLEDFMQGEASRFEVRFDVNCFRLYQSRLHSGGAIHHCLREYKAD